ncbi:MAG: glyoxalase/bleomycin resistance/extradiol dioxygenase family protein, partial [Actinobacteria bacterium]|nr:glyoxalase/bleomycin resistance/extradiol dioxygenase family protein [Actinomycetota bacterium]
MSRLQLALNVSDLDAAVEFYTRLFGVGPAKRKPGYANFAVVDPPLKLVLFEGEEGGTINHLGVETESADEVVSAESRLSEAGLITTGIDDTICCFAE